MNTRLDDIEKRVTDIDAARGIRCPRCGYLPPGANWCDDCGDIVPADPDLVYLLAVARAAERVVRSWDALNAPGDGSHYHNEYHENCEAEAALRAALEAK